MHSPASFPRRVLLCVVGMSPAVVTETIYGLFQRQMPFVPTEIHIMTTTKGLSKVIDALLTMPRIQQLYQQFGYGHALPHFDAEHIHVPKNSDGQALEDIRTADDNAAIADYMLELACDLTADQQSAVHASISGGRKTMSYYLGNIMSLVGRPQDRLSHVLATEPFEFNPDFFHPGQTPETIEVRTRNGMAHRNTGEAEITLSEIPFVALDKRLPKNFIQAFRRQGNLFSRAVTATQLTAETPCLHIDLEHRQITIGRHNPMRCQLRPAALALYTAAGLMKRKFGVNSAGCLQRDQLPRNVLHNILELIPGGSRVTELQDGPEANTRFYDNHANKLHSELNALSPFAADIYGLSKRQNNLFEIRVAPENIHIQWPDGAQAVELEKLDVNPTQ